MTTTNASLKSRIRRLWLKHPEGSRAATPHQIQHPANYGMTWLAGRLEVDPSTPYRWARNDRLPSALHERAFQALEREAGIVE